MLSGATGLVGSFLVDLIMYMNKHLNLGTRVIALGRSKERILNRFSYIQEEGLSNCIIPVEQDVNKPFSKELLSMEADYILHLASNTHPLQYSEDPIGTVTTNIIGTSNMLEAGVAMKASRLVFTSSVEVYGENRGDTDKFDENYLGYINCNTLRAGYPESKRAGEALCQAYIKQKGLDIVLPRLSRTYGPTMLKTDSKAISQFIKKGVASEDIILKSEGTQFYSYSYVADAVSGILYCMFLGGCGEAYNIADDGSDITLRDMAKVIAEYTGHKVVFELPDEKERAGYSTATKAILDGTKLKALGWTPLYNMGDGLERTIDILKELD
nr:NAD-dependent epimerase/dehydratase family protein [Butyrivibrio sp.]